MPTQETKGTETECLMKSDHRAVQNVFHNEGIPGINRLLDEGCSHYSMRRALKAIQKSKASKEADELEAHLTSLRIVRPRHRPTKPIPGQIRDFKIQKGKTTRYLRLPTDNSFPDEDAGENLKASFQDGKIIVTKRKDNDK